MSAPTTDMTVLNVRAATAVRARLEAVAEKLSERDLSPVNVSDALRMALGRGLPLLEAELGIEP
jgi:hypothetical protein